MRTIGREREDRMHRLQTVSASTDRQTIHRTPTGRRDGPREGRAESGWRDRSGGFGTPGRPRDVRLRQPHTHMVDEDAGAAIHAGAVSGTLAASLEARRAGRDAAAFTQRNGKSALLCAPHLARMKRRRWQEGTLCESRQAEIPTGLGHVAGVAPGVHGTRAITTGLTDAAAEGDFHGPVSSSKQCAAGTVTPCIARDTGGQLQAFVGDIFRLGARIWCAGRSTCSTAWHTV